MKKFSITASVLLFALFSNAQNLSFLSTTELSMKDTTAINLPKDPGHPINTLKFRVSKIAPTEKVTITTADIGEGTATAGTDYTFENGSVARSTSFTNVTAKTTSTVVVIDVKTITTKSTNALVSINLTSDNKYNKTFIVKLNFNSGANIPTLDTKSSAVDTAKWSLRIVTGGNFDFFNAPSLKNFAGDITAFTPNMFTMLGLKGGIEFNLYNYHYFVKDSTGTKPGIDAYFLHSKDFYNHADTTVPVVRRTTNFTRKYDYNVWGFSLSPLIQVASSEFAQLYFKFHLEGQATTETFTPTTGTTSRDTVPYYIVKKLDSKQQITAHPQVPVQYLQYTFYDFYFGFGFPLRVNLKNKLFFDVSPTFGVADIQNQPYSQLNDPSQRNSIYGPPRIAKFFYLTKFQMVTTVSPVDIALGGEYRGITGNMHYLTIYIGVSLTLDKLKK